MIKVYGNVWRLENEEDLSENCDCAKLIFDYVEKSRSNGKLKWFFKTGYVDFSEPKVTAIFESLKKPEYEEHLLAVTASKPLGRGWSLNAARKVI